MMLPPDDLEREPYHVPRGICPTCGSGDITHLVIGLPTGPDVMTGDPDWVRWVGCVHPGYNRECTSCGSTWSAQAAASDAPDLRRRTTPAPLPRPFKRRRG